MKTGIMERTLAAAAGLGVRFWRFHAGSVFCNVDATLVKALCKVLGVMLAGTGDELLLLFDPPALNALATSGRD